MERSTFNALVHDSLRRSFKKKGRRVAWLVDGMTEAPEAQAHYVAVVVGKLAFLGAMQCVVFTAPADPTCKTFRIDTFETWRGIDELGRTLPTRFGVLSIRETQATLCGVRIIGGSKTLP